MSIKNQHSKAAGIFLLCEGLPPSVIESQVLTHAHSMNKNGICMEVWAFAVTRHAYVEAINSLPRLSNAYSIIIKVFRGVKPALPFSEWLNALLLVWWMWWFNAKPPFIHARTEHAATIAAIVKKFKNYHLIWDARGDTLSEFRETVRNWSRFWKWLAPFKERAIANRLKIAASHCDFAFFVSNALRDLQGGSLPTEKTLIMPCLADESLFFYSPELRSDIREKLAYKKEDIVIVYVGSTALWQCIPETVALMKQALRANQAIKALIVTPNKIAFESLFEPELRDRVCITSGRLKEINYYLNAADFGVLIRKLDPINWVASPVKFAEYSLTGLTVITTDAVEQVKEIGQKLGNIINVNDFLNQYVECDISQKNRLAISYKAKDYLGREKYIKLFTESYNKSI